MARFKIEFQKFRILNLLPCNIEIHVGPIIPSLVKVIEDNFVGLTIYVDMC